MKIDSIIVRNYRCIGEMKLDRLSPITVLVGRNNTGKSAFIEALALASSASAGWYDALGGDLLDEIVERRGGYNYANLLVKMGFPKAEIIPTGENITGHVKIVGRLEDLNEDIRSILLESIFDYVNEMYGKIRESMYRSKRSKIRRLPVSVSDLERKAALAYKEAVRLVRACVTYHSKSKEKPEAAAVFGEMPPEFYESDLYDFIPEDEIIRSSPPKESKIVFPFQPAFDYIQDLHRRLTKSGELASLVKMINERVPYFQDIREVEDDLLVSIRGLQKPIPLESMGDGFSAELALLAATVAAKGGIVLAEEPETNLHPGYMSLVANQIVETASHKKAQFALSTHSLDFLEFILEASPELVSVVRMYRVADAAEIDYEVLNGNEALDDLKNLRMDLRGI